MKIYIDGDALPNLIKPHIFRAVERLKIDTYVVANRRINIGNSRFVNTIVVASGPDEADNKIVEMVEHGDLVITADIPLADRVVTKGAYAIDQRGEVFDDSNIKEILSTRNFMQELRNMGMPTEGPPPFGKKDVQGFVNQLDRLLTKIL